MDAIISITNVIKFPLRELSKQLTHQFTDDKIPARIEELSHKEMYELIASIGGKQNLASELLNVCSAELAYWREQKQLLKLNNTPHEKEEIEMKITSENARREMFDQLYKTLVNKYNVVNRLIKIYESGNIN